MRFFYWPCIFLASFISTTVYAQSLIVVTDSRHPVYNTPTDAQVIQLDTAQHLQAELSVNLPDDLAQAEQIASQRLQQGGTALQQSIQRAYQEIVNAWALGITSIPAVILDGHVVYGEPDVSKAIQRIQNDQRKNTQ